MSYVVKTKWVSKRVEYSVLSNPMGSSSNRRTQKLPMAFRIKQPSVTERSAVL